MNDKKLNILFFIGSIKWGGGTERSVSLISSYLSNKDFNVKILSFFDGKSAFYDTDPKVELFSLSMQNRNPTLSYFNVVYYFRKFLTENKIDIIIITDVILSLYVFPAIVGTKIKTIYRENFTADSNFNSIKRGLSRKIMIKYSDMIITMTDQDTFRYQSQVKDITKVQKIHNAKAFKSSNISDGNNNIVLSVGNLRKIKGHDLLLKSWKNIVSKHPKWTLQIVGGGSEEKNLKNLAIKLNISDSVDFVGQTNNVLLYYNRAAIFVLSSRSEGFPNVLLEAKEMGLPTVSFDCPFGPREVIREGIDGLLAEPEDINSLSQQLLKLIESQEMRREFAKAALNDDRFEKNNVLPKWEKLINKLYLNSNDKGIR